VGDIARKEKGEGDIPVINRSDVSSARVRRRAEERRLTGQQAVGDSETEGRVIGKIDPAGREPGQVKPAKHTQPDGKQ